MRLRLPALLLTLMVTVLACASEPRYPLILRGGRVMDPATGLDTIADVAVQDGRIVAISMTPLEGDSIVDVRGLVVAPGFIDLHAHGMTPADMWLKVRDGFTTQLEMEIGVYPVAPWYAAMEGTAPANFGATVSHLSARFAEFNGIDVGHSPTNPDVMLALGPMPSGTNAAATPEQVISLGARLQRGLDEGALGVGFGINYTPAATREEITSMFRIAAANRATAYVHTRAFGLGAVREAVEMADTTGASLHIVHIGSSGGPAVREALALIDSARDAGMDVSTEVYPYTAASTRIETALFDPGWQENLGISFGELAWPSTGERLTEQTFAKYRAQGGAVIIYMMRDADVEYALAHASVMIASDGMPFVDGAAHPRGAGTAARVLGRYTRTQQLMPLMTALAKMTILPALRLETYLPEMKRKGRIAVGADADITIFDPATVIDNATYESPMQASSGIPHVLVNGVFVVRDGEPVDGARPGRAVRRTLQRPSAP
jgi:N-acyl-D-aspartate/D-glutamate deacylase